MNIIRDINDVFKNAEQYICELDEYMYMESDTFYDYFKNIYTREYLKVPYNTYIKR